MSWKGEPPGPSDPHRITHPWLPLRICRAATYFTLFAVSYWTAHFAVHLFSSPPPDCTRIEFLSRVWMAFAPGYFWLGVAMLVCIGTWFILGRIRDGAT